MPITHIPNEADLQSVMIATEDVAGTFKTPTKRLTQGFTAKPGVGPLKKSKDATGGFNRTAVVRREFADPSGSFGGSDAGATFQELAIAAKYSVKGGVTGVSDGNTIPAYAYDFAPSFNADDTDSFSAIFGVDGLLWKASGIRLDEFNIAGDATSTDDQWTISGTPFLTDVDPFVAFTGVSTGLTTTTLTQTGAGWTTNQHQGAYVFLDYGSGKGLVRQVASNTATVLTFESAIPSPGSTTVPFLISGVAPSLARPNYDIIGMEGTKFFIDLYNPSVSTLGTTDISDRILSFNITQRLNRSYKRRASGIIPVTGRGARETTGTLRFEQDRWDEIMKWLDNREFSLRIEKLGPVIDPTAGTHHRARVDVERGAFDDLTNDTDNHNMTGSFTFAVYEETPDWNLNVITNLATLP